MRPPQQQRPDTHFYRPQVEIPEPPAQTRSQVMQVQANLRELNCLRLFHGGSLDAVTRPGDPNVPWDTTPLIPNIGTRENEPLFVGPEFVAPDRRLPEQHAPELDERMSNASSLNTYPENAGPGYNAPITKFRAAKSNANRRV